MPCPSCGGGTTDALCAFHVQGYDSWGDANRIMCDLLHRGVVPARLSEDERNDAIIPVAA